MAANEGLPGELAVSPVELQPVAVRARGFSTWRFIARRLALGLLTLLCVSILIFALTHVLPSDPARAVIGQFAEPAQIAAVRKELGLDKSVPAQYVAWIGDAIRGDLGSSYQAKEPVTSLIGDRLLNSLTLLALVALFALPISIALGILAAKNREKGFDHAISMTTMWVSGLPEFVIGIALTLLIGGTVLDLFPSVNVTAPGESPLAHPDGLVLPVATLVLAVVPYLTRLVRASMIEAMDSSYVEMAHLKGVPGKYVLRRHAFRNAMVPMIQATGHTLIYLLGNVVVVEFLFNYPGLGQALANAVSSRDLPMIQGIALVFGAMFVLFNIIADMLTVYASPRLRTEG